MKHEFVNKPSTGDGITKKVNRTIMKQREKVKKNKK
jgi:hypothetical protein